MTEINKANTPHRAHHPLRNSAGPVWRGPPPHPLIKDSSYNKNHKLSHRYNEQHWYYRQWVNFEIPLCRGDASPTDIVQTKTWQTATPMVQSRTSHLEEKVDGLLRKKSTWRQGVRGVLLYGHHLHEGPIIVLALRRVPLVLR